MNIMLYHHDCKLLSKQLLKIIVLMMITWTISVALFRSFDDTIGSSKQNLDVVPGMPNTRDNVKFESFTLKAPTDMQENFHTECSRNKENRVAIKTLILFEDVDTVFEEDCGFISSVLQLAETAKRPIILTSNSEFVVHIYRVSLSSYILLCIISFVNFDGQARILSYPHYWIGWF